MTESATDASGQDSEQAWYVYDRFSTLLCVASTLAEAETWAIAHWEVIEVGGREEVEPNDFYYLLLAAPQESAFRSRDYQARIMRRDRVVDIGRDPEMTPEHELEPRATA